MAFGMKHWAAIHSASWHHGLGQEPKSTSILSIGETEAPWRLMLVSVVSVCSQSPVELIS